MAEIIPSETVDKIFKLPLEVRLICDRKMVFPIMIKGRRDNGAYRIMAETGSNKLWGYNTYEIELKGKVDIEYVRYKGTVVLRTLPGYLGNYEMSNIRLYKADLRKYRRVPYQRKIMIEAPFQQEGRLMNISASGALLYTEEKIPGDYLTFEFILMKRKIRLKAKIIDRFYDERYRQYGIRCNFYDLKFRDKRRLLLLVRGITLNAKRRIGSL